MVFTTVLKVTKHLGYFCNAICYREILKMGQSCHTGNKTSGEQFKIPLKGTRRATILQNVFYGEIT